MPFVYTDHKLSLGTTYKYYSISSVYILILSLLALVIIFSYIYPLFNEYDAYENILDNAKNLSPFEEARIFLQYQHHLLYAK